MRVWMTLVMVMAMVAGADEFCYVRNNEVVCAPRELPSVGVRQDNGQAVLGLHGASDTIKRACGWYRVVESLQRAATNEVVISTTYAVQGDVVRPVYQFGVVRQYTLADRIDDLFASPEIMSLNNDDKTKTIIQELARAITNKLGKAEGRQ